MSLPTSSQLDAYRMQTDPVADDIVARLVAENGVQEARRVFDILIRNINIPFAAVPDYVREYMESNSVAQEGVDLEKVRRGQKVFVDYGATFVLILYCKSLPTCYLNGPGAPVLTQTGRLDKNRGYPEIYARRISETAQFLLDTMDPGSLEPGGNGVKTVLKVRLVHAAIRHFIQRGETWKLDEWQLPINQEDLIFTLFSFSYTMIEGMEQLGKAVSSQEAEDYYYAWALVGRYLGIEPELIPTNVADAKALLQLILDRHATPTEDGKVLTGALISFAQELIVGKIFDNTPEVFIRFFMKEEYAEMLGVTGKTGCLGAFLPKIISGVLKASENLEDRSETAAFLSNKAGIGFIKGAIKFTSKYKGTPLRLPESMKEAWKADLE